MNKKSKDAAKRIAVKFLVNWKAKKPDGMFNVSQKTWLYNHAETGVEWIKEGLIDVTEIQSFQLVKIFPITECTIDITAKIRIKQLANNNQKPIRHIKLRLIKEKAAYEPSEDGEWGVNPISAVRKIQKEGK